MNDCIFCAIAKHESPAEFEYEDSEIIAFNDVNPKAAVHLLIVPKKHIAAVTQLQDSDANLVGKMILVAKKMAEKKKIARNGYRLYFNIGHEGGQVVDHLHLHLLGGGSLEEIV